MARPGVHVAATRSGRPATVAGRFSGVDGSRCGLRGGATVTLLVWERWTLQRSGRGDLMASTRRLPPRPPVEVWDRADMVSALRSKNIGAVFVIYRRWSGAVQQDVSELVGFPQSRVSAIERGRQRVESLATFEAVATGLDMPAPARNLLGLAPGTDQQQPSNDQAASVAAPDEEDALELSRRISATDIGRETIERLEAAVDNLSISYSVTPPNEVLGRVRLHLSYVSKLIDVRKSLDEHQRLLTVAAWLSLLGATLHIDLRQRSAATARLSTATGIAKQIENPEILAWCRETVAWWALTEGDYVRTVELSRSSQEIAPKGSNVAIQATAQEGRAWARIGDRGNTYSAINRVGSLISSLERPVHPEHHYKYDPGKYTAYMATTLAWVGDPAAEGHAREVIYRLLSVEESGKWPRRVAAAKLDLALALASVNRLDEAYGVALEAIESGRVVPSNHWRALEVVRIVESRKLPEAKDLRDAFESMRAR